MFRFRVGPVKGTDINSAETLVEVICAITSVNAGLGFFKVESSSDLILGAALIKDFDCFKVRNGYSSAFVVIHSSNQFLASRPVFGILSPGTQHNIWTLYKLADGARIGESMIKMRGGNPLVSEAPSSSYDFPRIKKSGLAIKSSSCRLSLRMSPPNIKLSASFSSPSKLSQIDPHAFLAERYYSTLYQRTIPLQFFAKTALPRVHVLSHSNIHLARETISSFIIRSMTSFNQRFEFSRSSCTSSLNLLNDDELSYRVDFFRNSSGDSDEQFRASLEDLKLREAKLQVILNLELLRLLDGGKYHQKPTIRKLGVVYTKRSLVGRKKRLIPTLIGTAIPVHARFTTDLRKFQDDSSNELTSDLLMTNINALMDKLCVHDAIIGLSSIEDDSTYRFLVNSVAPFFQKSHPKLVRELLNKSKGPSVSKKSRYSHEGHLKTIHSPPPKPKSANRSDTSILGNSLEFSDLKLKRKASNLGMTQNLSKKTFDMIKSTSITQQLSTSQTGIESQPLLQTASNSSKTRISRISTFEKSAIFSHRKRHIPSKHYDNTEVQTNSYTEVEATPVKKPHASLEVYASPCDLKTTMNDISPIHTNKISDTYVSGTPLKINAQENENIIQTIENLSTASPSKCAETSRGIFANEIRDSFAPCLLPELGPPLPHSLTKHKSSLQRQSEISSANEHCTTKRKLTFS
ncbi:hypothetical protein KL928_004149 [Ogataea angusta]|uniref:DNA replication regulator Sld3 C-terminal domain-containing protein n=1 Tax=Pichia angusta TaxID=870730 RepID=A0AAN6DCY2_PICAN|nr:uncharacterized protein KL928_004149 [Ogataea angusta]KAG7817414.1 hypothetical protein KL928_004149 [Ogataea angusta]